jgi:hypothetical protein
VERDYSRGEASMEDNIKMDLRLCQNVKRIELHRDRIL